MFPMTWYQQALKENKKEIAVSAIVSVLLAVGFSVWYFLTKQPFHWQEINPFDSPVSYTFYSALVFVGPGAYLFRKKVYLDLWKTFIRDFYAPGIYRGIKRIMWLTMVTLAFVVVYIIIKILNAIVSILYNLTFLFLYLLPPILVIVTAFLICYFFFILKTHISSRRS